MAKASSKAASDSKAEPSLSSPSGQPDLPDRSGRISLDAVTTLEEQIRRKGAPPEDRRECNLAMRKIMEGQG